MKGWKLGDWLLAAAAILIIVGGITAVAVSLNNAREDESQENVRDRKAEERQHNRERQAEARHNAAVLYRNALKGCQRNNKPRRVLYRFAKAAAEAREFEAKHTTGETREVAQGVADIYRESANELSGQQYARADGSIRCYEAVKKPPSGGPVVIRRIPEEPLVVPAALLRRRAG